MTSPQSVTQRYLSNLIHNGRNHEFDIDILIRRSNMVDGTVCGYYFTAKVVSTADILFECSGATPTQAIQRCLEKHGVTFR